MSTQIIIAKDEEALSAKAAQVFLESHAQAVKERGRFTVALSGGDSPKKFFRRLAEPYYRDRVSWAQVYAFWGDERCVPPDHPESNYKMAHDLLLSKVPIPQKNILRIPAEMEPPHDAAKAYENTLKLFFNLDRPLPVFDFNLLGVGEDGHTASLFPGTTALKEKLHWVSANFVEKLKAHRITLTFPVINNSRRVVFLCTGAAKAPILKEVLKKDGPVSYPAQLVNPVKGELLWLLDGPAASKLPPAVHNEAVHV